MKKTIAMLLAGGVGSRLNILARYRAKPAVPFGGIYRIIDFALSNARNSGLVRLGVLTQYKPLSLIDHIGDGTPWDFVGRMRGATILAPRTGEKDSDWYKGTADAIRQNLDFINNYHSDRVLILSGDHIYFMDYRRMVGFHNAKKADLTIAMMHVPMSQTHHFGIGVTDHRGRLIEWEEKPAHASNDLASMGVYIFNTGFLFEVLQSNSENDFGMHIIAQAIRTHHVYAYPFQGYWRDVGTIYSYWDTNMDLLRPKSGLRPQEWRIYPNLEQEGLLGDRAPARVISDAAVRNSLISPGCVIRGEVRNSILSPGVRVEKDASVASSVILHDAVIAKGAKLVNVIADKETRFGENCRVGAEECGAPNRKFPNHLGEGLTVVGKQAQVPAGVRVGGNCLIFPRVTEACYDGQLVEQGGTIE